MALEKQSQRFITHMEGFLLRLEDELMDFTPVEYKNVTMTEAEMLDLFYNKFGEIPLLSRMDAVADTFIDEVETLKNKDLPEEEKQELIERFRQMYDTRDFYVLYNRFLEEEGLPLLPDLPPEEPEACLRGRLSHPLSQIPASEAPGPPGYQTSGGG